MFCKHCGAKIVEKNKFCISCGEIIEENQGTGDTTSPRSKAEQPEPASPAVSQTIPAAPRITNDPVQTEIHTAPSTKKNINKWLYIGMASVLILAAAGGGFYGLKSYKKSGQEASAALIASASPSASATPAASRIEHLNVGQVDSSQYPNIKVIVDVGAVNGLLLSATDFTVLENSAPQTVNSVDPMDGNKFTVSYQSKVVNNNPGSPDKRTLALKLFDKQAESGYDAPQQQSLSIGDISYNTDQYPNIKLYFSFYDSNNRLTESAPADVSFFSLNENNNKPLHVAQIAKMSDAKESLSTNVVIDVSSSMSDKIVRVKELASEFVNQSNVTPNDRIALMSFAGASEIKQNSFTSDKSSVSSQISTLDATGRCTALYRALAEAVYNTAYNGANGSKYVVLFTDGGENCSNQGVANQDTVNPETVINSAIQMGVPIYAVGVDQDDQLQRIAKQTHGEYISIGSNIEQLGQFYRSIYTKKKGQYIISYTSDIPEKSPRDTSITVNAPRYFSKVRVPVTPRLVDDPAVMKAMESYQMNWSAAMTAGDMSYLNPFVVVNSSSPNSVYSIVSTQVNSLNAAKQSGSYSKYDIPIYQMLDAKKVSASHYQLKVKKRFKRTLQENGNTAGSVFKETAYTYNIVSQNGHWLVDSTVESEVPEVCYTDQTFSQTKSCN